MVSIKGMQNLPRSSPHRYFWKKTFGKLKSIFQMKMVSNETYQYIHLFFHSMDKSTVLE